MVREGKEHSVEDMRLKRVVSDLYIENITKLEELVSQMRPYIKNERSQRWRHCVENSWAHKKI
eukprot:5003868-Heterocapsa_arctica.AAC.1